MLTVLSDKLLEAGKSQNQALNHNQGFRKFRKN